MENDQKIINQIRNLRDIKPDADWVILAKARVMGQVNIEQKLSFIGLLKNFTLQYRMALSGLVLIGLASGAFVASQNALPGEPLYALKKGTEKGWAIFVGASKSPEANLQLAAKRLEEISLISQKNLVKNLPVAFKEYNSAKTTAKKEMAAKVLENPNQAGNIVKQASAAMKNIDSREKQIYGALGLDENATSTDNGIESDYDKTIAGSLINYFKKDAILSDQQNNDLKKVKELYDSGNYKEAIDYYLGSSLNK